MQFTTALVALLATGTALAAPSMAPRGDAVSMMAATAQWTIQSMTRTCNSGDTQCVWTFGVNENTGAAVTAVRFVVNASGSTPASQSNGGAQTAGVYTITSGWSGQFGPGNGFTTLSVVDYTRKLIVWPAYTDKQLVNGQAVTPDQSYAPQTLG